MPRFIGPEMLALDDVLFRGTHWVAWRVLPEPAARTFGSWTTAFDKLAAYLTAPSARRLSST